MSVQPVETTSDLTVMAPEKEPVGLRAAAHLFDELNLRGLRYCHWKSNIRLKEALNGKTDLDLLVDPQQAGQFRETVERHGLKTLRAAPGKDYPGVENYLGFDRHSGSLFHLHVHYDLILGEQLVKNYVLPLRDPFLDSVRIEHGVLVPSPELELAVFCVRALLKYRDRDAFKDLLTIRSPGLSEAILDEVRWLLARTSPEQLARTLRTVEGVVPSVVVLPFLDVIANNPRDGARLYRLRARLRAALRPYRRRSQLHASLLYFRELWFRPRGRMRLADGGQSLALVGADGAGKSTMAEIILKWLSWKVDVRHFYLGSKKPSQRSKFLYLVFRMLRRSQRSVSRLWGKENVLARGLAALRQSLLYEHQVSLARDRLSRHREGQRLAQAGAIVIYDRFPLTPRLDGPKIRELAGNNGSTLASRYGQREEALYDSFQHPDHILLLDVTPDISLTRKPDHDRIAIQAKYAQLQQMLAAKQPPVVRIDATKEMNKVIADLKEIVWRLL